MELNGRKDSSTSRLEVIRMWLRGYSRDEIAKDVGIGTGTVSGILQQCRQDDADFDLLRGVALELRDRGMRVEDYAPLLRLKSLLEEKELRLEISQNENLFSEYKRFEAIIITLEVLCFKHEIPMDQFFERIRNLYAIGNLGIPIERLSEYLENQKNEILRLRSETKNEVERQGATMNLLQEYQANMPALKTAMNDLGKVTQERDSCRRELDYRRKQYNQKLWDQKEEESGWYVDQEEVKKAEMELSSEIGGDHYVSRLTNPGLMEIILDLYRHPGKYVESIRKVIDTYDLVHGHPLY
ncbi:MAG: helix-turn-helix domain-containing protein [Nitrososphaeraceae archaeon]